MLQQTTTTTVQPYFHRFLEKWPTVHDFAAADLDEVLHMWQGLGYYARARNLHKCAEIVSKQGFPKTTAELEKLPGIGPYTAAAIAAIAFEVPVIPVDTNVGRILARCFMDDSDLKGLRALAMSLEPSFRPGDTVQALMDLGATICTPRDPSCPQCPLKEDCRAFQSNAMDAYPVLPKKIEKPTRYGVVFWIEDANGAIFMRKRPPKGLLGGMTEFPSTPWQEEKWDIDTALQHAPVEANYEVKKEQVRHTFTHFHLRLTVAHAKVNKVHTDLCSLPDDFQDHALPTLMKKVAQLAA
ncbi:MAG: A/G-specific adenine glycosylase [Alphaproteobacteria bacterium]